MIELYVTLIIIYLFFVAASVGIEGSDSSPYVLAKGFFWPILFLKFLMYTICCVTCFLSHGLYLALTDWDYR